MASNPRPAMTTPETETVEQLKADLQAQELFYAELFEQLSYALLHDMSEMLRMVRSYVSLQNRRLPAAEGDKEFGDYLLDSAQRVEQLLAELAVYSHLFRPLEQLASSADSEAVLAGVLLGLDSLINKSGADVSNDPLPKVWCDATKLGHVFRHLILNAITYHGADPPRVHLSAVREGNQAVFSVRDNGLGIEPRFQEQIFAIFKRLHGRDYPGNGLGLAICKRIVEQYGGRIWVESEPGHGATFRFTLSC
jgi:light-regulated signal transduction histidine kinase (bacteriophytochrome)